ncbi:hypothetical protein ES288_D06G152800v1 [Gossypium darwinii]|uniref:Uncharacterized protein n=1 Tax=Gossypium darwinii TaxID=34276 RepID=A0A5D2C615_GOSDA|nr:hypothetical protein ES288_D06G152800v1 [Gossypium darwinii]
MSQQLSRCSTFLLARPVAPHNGTYRCGVVEAPLFHRHRSRGGQKENITVQCQRKKENVLFRV